MKLQKFKEEKKNQKVIILFTITCVLLITGVFLYKTFASFQVIKNEDYINGSIEDPGDIYFAFYKDNKIQKDMPQKEDGYILDEENSYCGVTGGTDPKLKVTLNPDNWSIVVEGVTTSRTKCNLYFIKGAYILGKGIPTVTEGNGLYEVKHDGVSGTIKDEGFKQTEYRYAGSNPDNYIKFNEEEWRIIGLVNVMTSEETVEQRVKIIRKDSIGNLTWDSSSIDINIGRGINEWSQADLMKLLNPGYENNHSNDSDIKFNNSLYWNSQNGKCYSYYNNGSKDCDFTQTGMKEKFKDPIEEVIWNTGSNEPTGYAADSYGNVNRFYQYERSNNNGKICDTTNPECNDQVERKTTWKGKVALMYPSDYGYASSGGSIDGRSKCLAKSLNAWGSSTITECNQNDWLYVNQYEQTITSVGRSSDSYGKFDIDKDHVAADGTNNDRYTRPVLYLKNNVKITSGKGTEENIYEINFLQDFS